MIFDPLQNPVLPCAACNYQSFNKVYEKYLELLNQVDPNPANSNARET